MWFARHLQNGQLLPAVEGTLDHLKEDWEGHGHGQCGYLIQGKLTFLVSHFLSLFSADDRLDLPLWGLEKWLHYHSAALLSLRASKYDCVMD